jgi:hypothetical protein
MNTSNIKKYAPVARKQFRDAVMQKLTTLGISADKKGNLQIASNRSWRKRTLWSVLAG